VWVTIFSGRDLLRIDPATNKVVGRTKIGSARATNAVRETVPVGKARSWSPRAPAEAWVPSFGGSDIWRLTP